MEIHVGKPIKGANVVQMLNRIEASGKKLCARIQVDNGHEFIFRDLVHFACKKKVVLDLSMPRKPTDNP